MPLRKTVNVILDRIYKDKLIRTTWKTQTLKKVIIDTCSKLHSVTLGPVLVNIIMTELERVAVDGLIQQGLIKFYVRYMDDTLLSFKPEDSEEILGKFNQFHKNLNLH